MPMLPTITPAPARIRAALSPAAVAVSLATFALVLGAFDHASPRKWLAPTPEVLELVSHCDSLPVRSPAGGVPWGVDPDLPASSRACDAVASSTRMGMTPEEERRSMHATTEEDAEGPGLDRVRRAVVVVDVVESVRLMRTCEDEVVARWRKFVAGVREEVLPRLEGRVVKSLGDAMLIELGDARAAVQAALAVHQRTAALNDGVAPDQQIRLRAGVHVGDVLVGNEDIYGHTVNLAVRLSGIAGPDQICVSTEVRDELLAGVDADIEDIGDCYLKHVEAPMRVFRVRAPGAAAALPAQPRAGGAAHDAAAPAERSCLAVMPLQVAESHGQGAALAELFTDTLNSRLSVARNLRVISRHSTAALAKRQLELAELFAHTRADFLVVGRLLGTAERPIVLLELLDAQGHEIVWSARRAFGAAELLTDDDEVTNALAPQIAAAAAEFELRRARVQPLPTLAAQSLRIAAASLMHHTSVQDFSQSHDVLEHLADRHPRNAPTQAWLAKWHVLRVTRGLGRPTDALAGQALQHTRRALDEDPQCALALAAEGFVHCHILRDLAGAEDRLARALELDPNESWAWLFRATVASFRGEGERAWEYASRARALSPVDPVAHYYDGLAASAAVAAERYREAIELAARSLRVNAAQLPTLRALVIAQVMTGELESARAGARRVCELDPQFRLRAYVDNAPAGGGEMRRRWADALGRAGIPYD